MIVVLTRTAQSDLADIYEFLAPRRASAARRVLTHLLGVIRQLADGELKGPEVRLADGRKLRRWPVPPYRVYTDEAPAEL